MALSNAARRAIAIRKSIAARKAANDVAPAQAMHTRLLAMCIDAGGFDQNARFA